MALLMIRYLILLISLASPVALAQDLNMEEERVKKATFMSKKEERLFTYVKVDGVKDMYEIHEDDTLTRYTRADGTRVTGLKHDYELIDSDRERISGELKCQILEIFYYKGDRILHQDFHYRVKDESPTKKTLLRYLNKENHIVYDLVMSEIRVDDLMPVYISNVIIIEDYMYFTFCTKPRHSKKIEDLKCYINKVYIPTGKFETLQYSEYVVEKHYPCNLKRFKNKLYLTRTRSLVGEIDKDTNPHLEVHCYDPKKPFKSANIKELKLRKK